MRAVQIAVVVLVVVSCVLSVAIPVKRRAVPFAAEAARKPATAVAGGAQPIHGNLSLAVFFAEIEIGTPPQVAQLQLDTGSSDLAVYGSDCMACGPSQLRYNISQSQSASVVPCSGNSEGLTCPICVDNGASCGYRDVYGDGSFITGPVALETFSLPAGGQSYTVTQTSFGVISSASANYEPNGVDGIWGLAYSVLSAWRGKTVFEQLRVQNSLPDVFSLCLQVDASYFIVGEEAPSGAVWTAVTQELYYVVHMDDFKVNGTSLGISESQLNEKGVIVDSGTTLLVVPGFLFSAIQSALQSTCQSQPLAGVCGSQNLFNGYCVEMSASDKAQFPDLQVTLTGAGDLVIPPSAYLFAGSSDPSAMCLAIAGTGSQNMGVILGDTFFASYMVTFDRAQSRVGFSPTSACPGGR